MKMDWNFRYEGHINRDDNFSTIPIMKMDWNFIDKCVEFFLGQLFDYSNNEDGLKLTNNGEEVQVQTIFSTIPIMKMDWNSTFYNFGFTATLTFRLFQ